MIELEGLGARAGGFALREVSLRVPAGGYGVVIGPAGAGKTTLLECIAGVRAVDAGRVRLWDADVTRTPPEWRALAMVYQHAYLFPHLGVRANVRYGAADEATAREASERLGVTALEGRGVRALSGGERQLVALARALATRPRVLLLDEPYAALDPRGRARARHAVRELRRAWEFTTLQVSHDFAEAGALGELLVLLDAGRVAQQGPPAEVFHRPTSRFVAEFLGAENVWAGVTEPADDGGGEDGDAGDAGDDRTRLLRFRTGAVTLRVLGDAAPGPRHAVLRAEEVLVAREPVASSARNVLAGVVRELHASGPVTMVTVDVRGTPVVAALTTSAARELGLAEGTEAWVAFKASAVHLC